MKPELQGVKWFQAGASSGELGLHRGEKDISEASE